MRNQCRLCQHFVPHVDKRRLGSCEQSRNFSPGPNTDSCGHFKEIPQVGPVEENNGGLRKRYYYTVREEELQYIVERFALEYSARVWARDHGGKVVYHNNPLINLVRSAKRMSKSCGWPVIIRK